MYFPVVPVDAGLRRDLSHLFASEQMRSLHLSLFGLEPDPVTRSINMGVVFVGVFVWVSLIRFCPPSVTHEDVVQICVVPLLLGFLVI